MWPVSPDMQADGRHLTQTRQIPPAHFHFGF